jgi:hypothetical protein
MIIQISNDWVDLEQNLARLDYVESLIVSSCLQNQTFR